MMSNKDEQQQAFELDENMKVSRYDEDGLVWYSPFYEPFQIAGFGWMKEDQSFRRLPVNSPYAIPPAVDQLANCTSGGQIRFRTNSPKVAVKVRLPEAPQMYHMPPTGEGGVDAYIGSPSIMAFAGTARFLAGQKEYVSELFSDPEAPTLKEQRQFTLNLPLYKGVEEIWIGLEPQSSLIEPAEYDSDKKVIFYGTSITQGGCASRPGMSYTNMLSRRMNLEFINLGFSGNGKGEPELAQLAAQITDPACLVLDYEANCTTEGYFATLPAFIDIYREHHPEVPIVVVSRIVYGKEFYTPELREGRLKRLEFQSRLVAEHRDAGDVNIHFVDGRHLIKVDPGEATVDGVHPTDLGFKQMADGLEPVLRSILETK